jgi:hypothetical protein
MNKGRWWKMFWIEDKRRALGEQMKCLHTLGFYYQEDRLREVDKRLLAQLEEVRSQIGLAS